MFILHLSKKLETCTTIINCILVFRLMQASSLFMIIYSINYYKGFITLFFPNVMLIKMVDIFEFKYMHTQKESISGLDKFNVVVIRELIY